MLDTLLKPKNTAPAVNKKQELNRITAASANATNAGRPRELPGGVVSYIILLPASRPQIPHVCRLSRTLLQNTVTRLTFIHL